ncbi:threonine transporter RhtB [Citrobacter amalonaticus]|uniref:Threonine transporter RhtB n=1 Tax=Citrobacter amalonaticus TaxID=35703 RepID=A0A2S4RXF4_CITAM|nr:LysE family transporter [Citrobacter amalonaticus]POT56109.1 threonine transporter RhtB [Citrobacter amalonaticus]POT74418.1 threonine transporter RhtB [Citrobacter amalonaticus]POU65217.1 threonine transporter RhtB [Citrobacter amalonaticus]POV04052.1 threonine transporter RhtB [Citrobacter amalonaticus]
MALLSVLFPSAFPALALAHFVALLSPGPDFFLLVGYAVRYRLRGSAGLCVGIAAGNGLYILLAIVGWGILRQFPLLFTLIELSGALYLLWIGSLLIRSRSQALTDADAQATCPGFGKQVLLGLGSSLLNPKNALFYLALMTALLGPSVTLLQQTVSGIWMASVVLCWDLLIAMCIGLPQIQRRLTKGILWIERLAGAVLIVFGSGILLRFLYDLLLCVPG